mmetsp:Transcript_7501/g.22809  ORF Transcript_7501/g.22809 Transcript_7501/m.22809 type:complete len:188 (-) Transcript_7501:70-633(-)
MVSALVEEFGDVFDIVYNRRRMGQLFALDKAYSTVTTPYILHCEDDWVFTGAPFLEASLSILRHEARVFTVHISNTSFLYPVADEPATTPDGVDYYPILNPPIAARDERPARVYALSFHPGLRRAADHRAAVGLLQRFFQEDVLNAWLFWRGFHMVKLGVRCCNHLDLNSISRHMEYHDRAMHPPQP